MLYVVERDGWGFSDSRGRWLTTMVVRGERRTIERERKSNIEHEILPIILPFLSSNDSHRLKPPGTTVSGTFHRHGTKATSR